MKIIIIIIISHFLFKMFFSGYLLKWVCYKVPYIPLYFLHQHNFEPSRLLTTIVPYWKNGPVGGLDFLRFSLSLSLSLSLLLILKENAKKTLIFLVGSITFEKL